jgi:hypothetical protein
MALLVGLKEGDLGAELRTLALGTLVFLVGYVVEPRGGRS